MARNPREGKLSPADLARILAQWLNRKEPPRRRLTRRIRISGPARESVLSLPRPDQFAFAELLLKPDANPIAHSRLIVPQRGLYAATFPGSAAAYTVLFEFNFVRSDQIRIADIH